MATNYGVEVTIDSSVSASDFCRILDALLRGLVNAPKTGGATITCTATFAAAYAAGTTSKNQTSYTFGGASADRAIRVVWDTAVIGTDETPIINSLIERLVRWGTITVSHSSTGAYVLGDRAYQVTLTLS